MPRKDLLTFRSPNLLKMQALKNENGCLIPQMLPWNRPTYDTKWVANAGEGWESNWAAKTPHLISNAWAQVSTLICLLVDFLGMVGKLGQNDDVLCIEMWGEAQFLFS